MKQTLSFLKEFPEIEGILNSGLGQRAGLHCQDRLTLLDTGVGVSGSSVGLVSVDTSVGVSGGVGRWLIQSRYIVLIHRYNVSYK